MCLCLSVCVFVYLSVCASDACSETNNYVQDVRTPSSQIELRTPSLKMHIMGSTPATIQQVQGGDNNARVGRCPKLQALVYDILPSTTAVFSYAIGSRKLSANKQFFVGAQTVVSLLQTTQIKQGVLFIAANKVYTNIDKTKIV